VASQDRTPMRIVRVAEDAEADREDEVAAPSVMLK